jgi:hypothetical protein
MGAKQQEKEESKRETKGRLIGCLLYIVNFQELAAW